MKVFFAFVRWTFSKIGEGLVNTNRKFRYTLQDETPLGIFIWFAVSLLSSFVVMLALFGIQYVTGINIPVQVWFAYIWACVLYLLYTGISLMYNAFKAERAELFEIIKNGR